MNPQIRFLLLMLLSLVSAIACGGQNENIAAVTIIPTNTHTIEPDPTNTNTATNTLPPPIDTATSTTVLSPTFTTFPTSTPAPIGQVTTAVSILSQPDPGGTVVTTLNTGATVEVIALTEDGHWYQVRTASGREGWLQANQLIGVSLPLLTRVPRVTQAPTSTTQPVTLTPRPQATNTRPLVTNTPTLAPATSTSAPTQPPAPTTNTPPPAAVCDCSGNIYNCSDFSTHNAAQACFNYCVAQGVGDIHGLDADSDGIACESLP